MNVMGRRRKRSILMQTAQKSSSSDTHQGILLSGNLKK
jgi:hypothetical protein